MHLSEFPRRECIYIAKIHFPHPTVAKTLREFIRLYAFMCLQAIVQKLLTVTRLKCEWIALRFGVDKGRAGKVY